MTQITITGEARTLEGTLLTGRTIILRRDPLLPMPDGGIFRVPEPVTVVTSGAALVNFIIPAGAYVGEMVTAFGTVKFPFLVADTPSSQAFSDCLQTASAAIYDPLAFAMLVAGLRFYGATLDAKLDDTLASWAYFIAFNSGVLYVWRKTPMGGGIYTATPIDPVFPGSPALDGTAALPGMTFASDPDTGVYRASANVLGLAAGGTGLMTLATAGATLDVPLTGLAVTQTTASEVAGRLLKVGDYGLGAAGIVCTDWDSAIVNGTIYMAAGATNAPLPTVWFIGSYHRNSPTFGVQTVNGFTGAAAGRTWTRRLNAGAWTTWREVFNQASILATVSQASGVPTGGIIERGSNGNGEYVRYADGTQMCWRTLAASAGAAVTWTFPVAFGVAPVISGTAIATVLAAVCLDAAPGASSASLSVRDKADARRADTMHLRASGRWF